MSDAIQAKPRPRRVVREYLESFGIAILMAVLLKPTVLEAYQIPTSSMQPTLMGSTAAGVYDRILVDKMRYLLFEPERFDVAVFRYPIRQNQNYVKRICGMPGDRLRLAGGNLYQVGADGKIAHVLRKPDDLQEDLWKEIYPARRLLDEIPASILGSFWSASGTWREEGATLVATIQKGGSGRLSYYDDLRHGGIVNRYYDGYPTSVARALLTEGQGHDLDGVQDVRLSASLAPATTPDAVILEVLVTTGGTVKTFSLECRDGKAKLRATVQGREVLVSEPCEFPIVAGGQTKVMFAHVDDQMIAWRNGVEVARISTDREDLRTLPILQRGEMGSQNGTTTVTGKVDTAMIVTGGGTVRVTDLKLERDHHYMAADRGPFSGPDHVIEVPAGKYFMLGDNPLQSADGRMWMAIEVGVTADGWMVAPNDPKAVRTLVGNSRARTPDGPVDADENPVVLRGRDKIVFTDLPGEVHLLKTTISPAYRGEGSILFGPPGKEWSPSLFPEVFVPREHLLGRALTGFWPIWPFGPHRAGFIR